MFAFHVIMMGFEEGVSILHQLHSIEQPTVDWKHFIFFRHHHVDISRHHGETLILTFQIINQRRTGCLFLPVL